MWEALINMFSRSITDYTVCRKVTITATTYITPTMADGNDYKCKFIEVKNRSGVGINIIPNKTDEFPLADGEDRAMLVTKLSDIQLARQSGSGNVTVHLIIEN